MLRAAALSASKLGDLAYQGGDLTAAHTLYHDALAARRHALAAVCEAGGPGVKPSSGTGSADEPTSTAAAPPPAAAAARDGETAGRTAAASGPDTPNPGPSGDGAAGIAGGNGGGGSAGRIGAVAVPQALDVATSLCKVADLDGVRRPLTHARH